MKLYPFQRSTNGLLAITLMALTTVFVIWGENVRASSDPGSAYISSVETFNCHVNLKVIGTNTPDEFIVGHRTGNSLWKYITVDGDSNGRADIDEVPVGGGTSFFKVAARNVDVYGNVDQGPWSNIEQEQTYCGGRPDTPIITFEEKDNDVWKFSWVSNGNGSPIIEYRYYYRTALTNGQLIGIGNEVTFSREDHGYFVELVAYAQNEAGSVVSKTLTVRP